MKTCTGCKQEKPLTDFWKDRRRKGGLIAQCKECRKARFNQYRNRSGYNLKRYWSDPQGERERHLIRKYGVTLADYDRMFAKQDGKCAICKKTQERAFDVDHCHKTGRVRGLLCTSCNRMIGHGGDSAERLLAGASYLAEAETAA